MSDIVQNLESCRLCPRLADYREKVAQEKRRAYKDETYWGKPVPGFGDLKGPNIDFRSGSWGTW